MPEPTAPITVSRREAMQTLVQAVALAAGMSLLPGRRARGADTPHLDVKDPAAQAVGYVENAANVDPKKYPAYAIGSNCANCLQLQGAAGKDYRPCALFPGKLVAVAGWCNAWTAEI